ncbi:SpoIIE family protein phosphatase [Kitasatospora sp. NBC_01287]|uniref:SpoIIE family protein phosphatase n=1 Tax=Kitasatospora sp. NBC_01287 TaxID=2903573 RepID=UPI002254A4AF|nr:SpoIIE family protein phosphatase [Kitasatospora sp. NBC_01287]MCX4746971.1 SpoIIE family protein phosphatase [Kitasatospora sp. NBC_01287]
MPAREALTGGGQVAVPGQAGAPVSTGVFEPAVPGESAGPGASAAPGAAPRWGGSDPGSIYEYIRVATFSIGRDGRISQWSERAADFFALPAADALGADPVTTLVPRELWRQGRARLERTLAGEEWVGTVPYREPAGAEGLAEVYLMPADGSPGALCLAVDLGKLRRIETDLAASEAVFGQTPSGFFLFDRQLRLQRVNQAFADAVGVEPDALCGLTSHDLFSFSEAERLQAALRQVLESGNPVVDLRFSGAVPTRGGERRWAISLYRLTGPGERPMGVAGQVNDVTSRHVAEREAAGVRRNLALVNEASAHIGSTLDLETTAKELLDVVVPQFCDLATVDLYSALLSGETGPSLAGAGAHPYDGSGELRRVAVSSVVGGAASVLGGDHGGGYPNQSYGSRLAAAEAGGTLCYPPRSPHARALRTGRSAIPDPGPDPLLRSTLVVPLVARNVVLGLIQLSRAIGSEPFDARDVAIAEEIAARAAVCVDNARLYRREHERALILQRSLLPPGNPEASGLEIACRYRPSNNNTEVGGDWFDVIALPGNRTALVIGDVMGRGLRAAVAMGQLRTAVRTLAMLDLEPAEVLSSLDEIARGLGDPGPLPPGHGGVGRRVDEDAAEVYLATCVYAVYDAVTRRCTFANAGHLPPALLSPGEPARMLDVPPGLPLGVGGEPFEEVTLVLPDGALLGLYTDGLVESRKHQLDEGLHAFRAALENGAPVLETLCDQVLNELDPHHGEDDIALLMARVCALPEDSVGDWRLPSEPTSVSKARERACAWLLARGLDELVDTTELLVSELVTNALRHGRGDIRLRLLRDTAVVCEVWDDGYAQPRQRRAQETDEGGRGLQLVSLLAERWGSRRTPHGKIVWFELSI